MNGPHEWFQETHNPERLKEVFQHSVIQGGIEAWCLRHKLVTLNIIDSNPASITYWQSNVGNLLYLCLSFLIYKMNQIISQIIEPL
jgi:hypothetical protein